VLAEFKSGRSPIMIATDVASRGLGTDCFLSLARHGLARWCLALAFASKTHARYRSTTRDDLCAAFFAEMLPCVLVFVLCETKTCHPMPRHQYNKILLPCVPLVRQGSPPFPNAFMTPPLVHCLCGFVPIRVRSLASGDKQFKSKIL
jgi:hypothetical protein